MNVKETLLIVVQFMFPEGPMTHQTMILPAATPMTVYLMIVNLQAVVVAQTVLVVKVMMGRLVDMMDPMSQAVAVAAAATTAAVRVTPLAAAAAVPATPPPARVVLMEIATTGPERLNTVRLILAKIQTTPRIVVTWEVRVYLRVVAYHSTVFRALHVSKVLAVVGVMNVVETIVRRVSAVTQTNRI